MSTTGMDYWQPTTFKPEAVCPGGRHIVNEINFTTELIGLMDATTARDRCE